MPRRYIPTGRISRECTVCHFLAGLDHDYRAEVLDALKGWQVSTAGLLRQLAEDGRPTTVNRYSWEKHRRGECNGPVRARLLGECDGVRGPGR